MKQIRHSRKKAIKTALDDTYNLTTNTHIATYLQTYIDCEIIAHKLIKFYKKDHQKTTPSTLYLPNIIKAVDYYGLNMKRDALINLFAGGAGKRHQKTPRQLRNAYVHAKLKADGLEMIDNFQYHMPLMESFLKTVKNYYNL